jgi:hypothetical protein
MTIIEYADMIRTDLVIRKHHNQCQRWTASFEHAETKRGDVDIMLTSTCGEGDTANQAINNYIDEIKGKVIVLNSTSKTNRKEFGVPSTIEYEG